MTMFKSYVKLPEGEQGKMVIHVGKTMSCLPPMTGNGNMVTIPPIYGI